MAQLVSKVGEDGRKNGNKEGSGEIERQADTRTVICGYLRRASLRQEEMKRFCGARRRTASRWNGWHDTLVSWPIGLGFSCMTWSTVIGYWATDGLESTEMLMGQRSTRASST